MESRQCKLKTQEEDEQTKANTCIEGERKWREIKRKKQKIS
jgi:hypothetical protein